MTPIRTIWSCFLFSLELLGEPFASGPLPVLVGQETVTHLAM